MAGRTTRKREIVNGGDDLVFEIADAGGAGKALAAFLEHAPRLGAPLLERRADDGDRRLPEALVVGDSSRKAAISASRRARSLLRLGATAARRERVRVGV